MAASRRLFANDLKPRLKFIKRINQTLDRCPRTATQDDLVALVTDKHLAADETKRFRQPHGLTAAMHKQLGCGLRDLSHHDSPGDRYQVYTTADARTPPSSRRPLGVSGALPFDYQTPIQELIDGAVRNLQRAAQPGDAVEVHRPVARTTRIAPATAQLEAEDHALKYPQLIARRLLTIARSSSSRC